MSDNNLSLADIANLNLDGVQELRSSALPAGVYDFEVEDTEITAVERKIDGQKTKIPQVNIKLKVVRPVSFSDPSAVPDPAAVVGRTHIERFGISPDKALESLGYLKAFMVDAGLPSGNGKLQELLANLKGRKFTAPIKHTPDKDDSEKIYSNLNRTKMVPIAA